MARPRPRHPAGPHRQTSPTTLAAARAVLSAAGWREEEDFRLRPSGMRSDEVMAAPVVGGIDTMPGTGCAEWADQEHKAAWFAAARALRQVMADAGWTDHGCTGQGTYYRRPDLDGPDQCVGVEGMGRLSSASHGDQPCRSAGIVERPGPVPAGRPFSGGKSWPGGVYGAAPVRWAEPGEGRVRGRAADPWPWSVLGR